MDMIVLGVDGVDPELLEEAIDKRDCGNWRRLKKESFYSELPSTVPAVTIPAWVSAFSGYGPGRFDTYHLSQPDYSSWELDYPSSSRFRGDFFWDRIDSSVALHYVPGTSPVYPVNGWMRGGFPSPEDFEFYPESLEQEFGDLETAEGGVTSSSKVEAEIENYRTERDIARGMMDRDPEVFVSVIRVTDSAGHRSEKRSQILDVYETVDREIGRIIDRAEQEDANLVVFSDHGFFQAEKKFNISDFLEQEGLLETGSDSSRSLAYRVAEPLLDTPVKRYLKYLHDLYSSHTGKDLNRGSGDVLSSIEKSSRVLPAHFGLGKDCVLKVHTDDMPHGSVGPAEKEEILGRLEQELEGLEKDGDKVVEEVWRAEKLYGEETSADLVFRTTPGFIVETTPSGKVFSRTRTFTHRENGVFFAAGPDIDEEAAADPGICDVAPLVYALLEEPVPDDLDGELPEELVPGLKPEYSSTEVEEISV